MSHQDEEESCACRQAYRGDLRFKTVGEKQALAVSEKYVSVLDVWLARLAHAESRSLKWVADKDAVSDVDRCQPFVMDDCSRISKEQWQTRPLR